MSFEKKIEKELDRYERQWCDAVCPSVTKFGRQADKRISELEAKVERLENAQKEAYGAGWEDGRNSASVTGDWTYEYEEWAASLNGLLELRVERLEKEIQTEINYHSGTDSHYRAERLKAALEDKQGGN